MTKLPIIVVGGSAYADIDVLACVAAYKQYLHLQDHLSHAVITGPWNQTISRSIKKWPIDVEKKFPCVDIKCQYVLVDFSDPKYVDSFVDLDAVVEVFDHHYGYEEYWQAKIGDNAKIETVGACATLIWEKFKAAKIGDKISPVNANLLYTAIFANTLDFKSAVTQERDRVAAKELLSYTTLPHNWKTHYYAEIDAEFSQNCVKHILEDTKNITLFDITFNFGQIELTNARNFLQQSIDSIAGLSLRIDCNNDREQWLVNAVSIQENCSYLYCNNPILREKLKEITSAEPANITGIESPLLVTPRLWLRKELLKAMMIRNANKN